MAGRFDERRTTMDMISDWFFISWAGVLRVVVVSILAYIGLVALLRISGKRTLTKLNAFDLVVTVALGSILATILLSDALPLAEGIAAFIALITLQYIVTTLSVRSPAFRRLVKSEPTLLFYRGQMLLEPMRKERVTEEEVRAAMRAGGATEVDEIGAVILETDGSFSVLKATGDLATTASQDVSNYPSQTSDE